MIIYLVIDESQASLYILLKRKKINMNKKRIKIIFRLLVTNLRS